MKVQIYWLFIGCLAMGFFCGVYGQSSVIKPLHQVPDYNGTYEGSVGTGSARYTTLYRDNQDNGRRSGCRGEGCGKHPGVDIAVPTGTNIYNPLAGTVVVSRCDSSWGGLIVIKSPHPTQPWANIYQTFAHLIDRRFSDGQPVRVGDYVWKSRLIGKTGGGRQDPCRGYSTGAHLHYQIDRDDGNAEPWYPSGSVHYPDTNFEVARKTYNPMVFLQHGYKWSFNEPGNRELWDIFNWQSWGVSDGALWFDGSSDPYIRRGGLTRIGGGRPKSSSISAAADQYSHVYIDLYTHCYSREGKIYFTTSSDPNWDEYKTVAFAVPGYGVFRGDVYMGVNPQWQGIITGLRVDPATNCGRSSFDPVYFGEIAIKR